MEKSKGFGGRRYLVIGALLTLFTINIAVTPPSARDFASVLVAMAALGFVLFLYSRQNTNPMDAPDLGSRGSADQGSACVRMPAFDLDALVMAGCEVAEATFVCLLVLDHESNELCSKTASVTMENGTPRRIDQTLRISRSDAPWLHETMVSRTPRACSLDEISALMAAPNCGAHIWALPLSCMDESRGVLIAGRHDPFPKASMASLSTIAASAAALIAAEEGRSLFLELLGKIKRIVGALSHVAPQAPTHEVKRAIIDGLATELATNLVALYTIDPMMGGIESEASDGVSSELRTTFMEHFGDVICNRESREPLVLSGPAQQGDLPPEARAVFARNHVETIIACPVRSEMGISGAAVAFYTVDFWVPEERRAAAQVVADLVASALCYASAMEESGNLLDDLAGANQELSLQATMDGLTGLANHRTLQQTLADLCKPARSNNKHVFSLLMLDADHFKIYNDTHGHRQGDAALRDIARLISSELRGGDLAARYGGEEFAIVLRGIGKDSALPIAERIRRRAADHQLQKGSLTLSIGVAEFPADGDTPAEVIERADRALYHAKVTGRNRVVVWGSGGCSTSSAASTEDGKQQHRSVLVVTQASEPMGKVIGDTLTAESYAVVACSSTEEAAEAMRKQSFDLAMISLDALPNADIKSLAMLTSMHPDLPIVLIASDLPIELSRAALRQGASDVLSTPFVPEELPLVVERNIERRRVERQRVTEKSTSIMLQAIEALVAAIDAKDHYTAGHSQRVTSLALAIADDLSLSNEDRYALELAAKLHDVGKVALPDSALNKQSPLNEAEWQAMREHPAIGCKIVATIDELAYVSAIIRHHHERLDGTGYPDGLQGQAIPYLAQVIAVADSYEAMTSERAYRGSLSHSEAIEELRSRAGTYYAPEIVEILDRKVKESDAPGHEGQTAAA